MSGPVFLRYRRSPLNNSASATRRIQSSNGPSRKTGLPLSAVQHQRLASSFFVPAASSIAGGCGR